jgi:hypothetical protein
MNRTDQKSGDAAGRPADDGKEGFAREAELEFTLGLVWREERISCPHRDILRAFVDESLPEGAMDYIRFHIQQCECPYCGAVVDDLRDDVKAPIRKQLEGVKDRLMRSTAMALKKRKR